MDAALRVLLVEDDPTAAARLIRELKALGAPVEVTRVQTIVSMVKSLDHGWWDVVIASHGVPNLSAPVALELVQARSLDLPFIVLVSALQEATVAPLLEQGAHDYLIKDNLTRLVPIIRRERRVAQIRSERRQALRQIEYLAYYDPHTGLPNQNRLVEAIDAEIAAQHPYVVAFLNLDQYRDFRYGYGHLLSEQLLLIVGHRLRTLLPRDAMLARVGRDDTFAILFRALEMATVQTHHLPHIHQGFEGPIDLGHFRPLLSLSVGLTDHTLAWVEAEACLRAAEMAHYQAQQQAGTEAVIYQPPMKKRAQARAQLETDLRQALRQGQLQVAYQPIVSLQTGRIAGFEALARWHHPTRGWIPPTEFIPLAEQTGLIVPVGNWIFEQALTQVAQWHQQFPQQCPLFVSVNLSALQLCQPHCINHLLHQYQQAQLDGSITVVLEVTEGMLLHDMEAAIAHLEACQRHGFRISLDDFGTGYSSLSYLHRLPINTIKIDRSFVARMLIDAQDASIVRTIQTLATAWSLAVIAEGIETVEQMQALQALGCQYGQGHVFSVPLAVDQVTDLLRQEQHQPPPLASCPPLNLPLYRGV
jgi:EAL domain-containing protein (putative c-di-GMP-specific phosphodiesterase class I)/GGDEF domain-containing protein